MKMKETVKRLSPRRKGKHGLKETLSLDLMVLPGMLLLLVFNYIPMLGLPIAFKDFNPNLGIFGSEWNGFDNFKFFFTSQDAVRTIGNTLRYSITFLVLDLLCAVGLALMFYNLRSRRALKVYNTVVILPKFLSAVIIAFLVYIVLNPSYGLLNQLIKAMGGKKIQWYSDPKYWPFILTITHVWQTIGMNSIIYYASLMGLDDSLLEAARLDGANKWQETWNVVIPHLIPVMVINTILNMGRIFTGDFGLFYQTPKDVGALYATTDIINTYTYRTLMDGNFARSAAIGLFQSVVGTALVLITNQIVRKVSPEHALF